jgi:hypothetical protein
VVVVTLPIIGLAFFLVSAAESTRVFGSIVLAVAFFVLAMIAVGLVSTTLHAIYASVRCTTALRPQRGVQLIDSA